MAIKKVVNKTNKTVKKFPEFDNSKIYVKDVHGIIKRLVAKEHFGKFSDFRFVELVSSTNNSSSYSTFYNVIRFYSSAVYILNNQDELARFLLGCREFPKVEEIEVGEELAKDEVSVDDVSQDKIYAVQYDKHIGKAHSNDFGNFRFITLKQSRGFLKEERTLKGLIKKTLEQGLYNNTAGDKNIYQFDTQEEFLRWSLEQVTGKKFYHVSPGCCIPYSKDGSLEVLA